MRFGLKLIKQVPDGFKRHNLSFEAERPEMIPRLARVGADIKYGVYAIKGQHSLQVRARRIISADIESYRSEHLSQSMFEHWMHLSNNRKALFFIWHLSYFAETI